MFLPDARISDHIIHAGVVVDDFGATAHFYRDLLGFQEGWRGSANGKEVTYANLCIPDSRDFVEYMVGPAKRQPHFCFEVPDVKMAKAKLEQTAYFASYGKPLELRTGRNHKRQLNLYSPEGLRVELMEPNTVDGQPAPSSNAPLPKSKRES